MKRGGYFILTILVFSAVSASAFSFDDAIGPSLLGERRLLQAKTPCPVSFEFENYTIITSQCKGPDYPPKLCCSALKQFACPNAEYLNDLTNDCASTMFSYINLYGKYPPGLFSSVCREGPLGLECPPGPPSRAHLDHSAAATSSSISNRWILSSHLLQALTLSLAPLCFLVSNS